MGLEYEQRCDDGDTAGETTWETMAAQYCWSSEVHLQSRDSQPEKPTRLEGEDSKRVQYLQDTLIALIAFYGSRQGDAGRVSTPTEQQRALLQTERSEGIIGSATREAYKKYIDWLEMVVPATIRELDSMLVSLPPGCPLQLPADQYDRASSPQFYHALISEGKLKFQLQFDSGKLPTDSQLDQLDAAYRWLGLCNQAMSQARLQQRERTVEQLIRHYDLPLGWHKRPDDEITTYVVSAEEMVDLALRVRNYVEAMHSLFKASRNDDFPMELPSGTTLVVETSGGILKNITDHQLNDPAIRAILKSCTIKQVKFDLPTDLRQQSVSNANKIARLREWLTTNGGRVDQAVGELVQLNRNPDAVLMYGDQEVRDGKALFNQNNEFVALVTDKYRAKPGETVRDANLVGYDFQVEEISTGPLKGKFRISQTITAEQAPWYAYQNLRALGVQTLGQPMPVDDLLTPQHAAVRYKVTPEQLNEMITSGQLRKVPGTNGQDLIACPKIMDASDYVCVRDGSRLQMVQAKNLKVFHDTQKAWYVGEKALSATVDAAMLVSGTIEIGAAVKGARLAVSGAEAALRLSAREATTEIAKGTLRVVVAGAGVLNNAGARDTELGRTVNTARGIYFLGDIGFGLVNNGWSVFRAGKATEAMSGAQKAQAVIQGRQASAGGDVLKGTAWISTTYTGTQWAFRASEIAIAPVVTRQVATEVRAINDSRLGDPTVSAVAQVGDGRGLQLVSPGDFAGNKKLAAEATCEVLQGYAEIMSAGRSLSTQREVAAIFAETSRLIGGDRSQEERARFLAQLVAKLTFTPEQIRVLELAHPQSSDSQGATFHLTTRQLHDLLDPEKRKSFPSPVREVADRLVAARDKDIDAAARIALLYLLRDKDGNISSLPVSIQTLVPKQTREVVVVDEGHQFTRQVNASEAQVEQNISVADLIPALKHDLETDEQSRRSIVIGELLTRVGAITHQQYGGILQDLLVNQHSTTDDKMAALFDQHGARMAVIIDCVRLQESATGDSTAGALSKSREGGAKHGLSSTSLLAMLERVARDDKSPEVRAGATLILFALRESTSARRAELLNAFNLMHLESKKQPGSFAERASSFLMNELRGEAASNSLANNEVRERQLNAAIALNIIVPKSDTAVQKTITEAMIRCLKDAPPALALRAIDTLLPDRIVQLQHDNPSRINEIGIAIVKQLKLPETRQEEKDCVAILERLNLLLKTADVEVKRQVVSRLHDFLRHNALNPDYAKFFPALRAAAITTLIQESFLTQNSLEIIRSHVFAHAATTIMKPANSREDRGSASVTGAGEAPVPSVEVTGNEPDAMVRLSAVRALEKLKDPHLRVVVNHMIDNETDPVVAAELRDIRFTKTRVEPESREYKESYERTRVQLAQFGEKYPYLKSFDDTAQLHWIQEKFPLLSKETYLETARNAVENATSFLFRRTSFEETINLKEYQALQAVHNQRMEQWKMLTNLAKQGGEDGNKAKLLLHYIVTHNGSPAGDEAGLKAGTVKGYYQETREHKIFEPDWKMCAARELAAMCAENPEGKEIVAHCVRRCLTSNEQLSGATSATLLDGWRALGAGSEPGAHFAVSRQELAEVTAEALMIELGRQKANQTEYYQQELINDLNKYRHRMVFPVLEAMKDSSQFERIRVQCGETVSAFRDSTMLVWDETQIDRQSSAQARAERLKAALQDQHNAETTVQEIFNAYKGHKFVDHRDPGLAYLQLALNDNNLRVRLAAAKVLSESNLHSSHPAKAKATLTIARLAVTAASPVYRQESLAMLSVLNLDVPMLIRAPDGNIVEISRANGQVSVAEYQNGKKIRLQVPALPGR